MREWRLLKWNSLREMDIWNGRILLTDRSSSLLAGQGWCGWLVWRNEQRFEIIVLESDHRRHPLEKRRTDVDRGCFVFYYSTLTINC